MILRGRGLLTWAHIRMLAKRFKVTADLFPAWNRQAFGQRHHVHPLAQLTEPYQFSGRSSRSVIRQSYDNHN